MTTEIKIQSSLDAFSQNEFVALDREVYSIGVSIAAVEWTARRMANKAPFLDVLSFVFEKLSRTLRNYDCWLLIGDAVWQPDTRIARYKKTFKSLKMQGIDFETVADRFESVVEMDGKLKFFGAVRLEHFNLAYVERIMTPRPCAYIVALPNGRRHDFSLSLGWSGIWNEDGRLIKSVIACDGIVLQRTGFFDDPEVGLIGLCSPTILESILI